MATHKPIPARKIKNIQQKLTRDREKRLKRIRQIIEDVDSRCLHTDGPVTPTLHEMRHKEICAIYALACGKSEDWRPPIARFPGSKTFTTGK